MAYNYPFRMASGTATMLVIDPVNGRFLNGIRSSNAWVYPGANSLPGGFMEARFVNKPAKNWRERLHRWLTKLLLPAPIAAPFHDGEDLEQCALRELKEELGVDFTEDQLNMFAVRSNSRTDTRAHVINTCYWLEATPLQISQMEAGDDLKGLEWISFGSIIVEPLEMAFNHMEVTYQGLRAYFREKLFQTVLRERNNPAQIDEFINMDAMLESWERKVANV